MTTHYLKIREEFANDVLSGKKTFETRKNDRNYQVGDIVIFTVVDNGAASYAPHPLNGILYRITYVLAGWGLRSGFVAFSMKKDTTQAALK